MRVSDASLAHDDFGAAALRLAGFCCLSLGWSPDQFWAATPAELAAVGGVLAPSAAGPVTLAELRRLETGDG